MPERLRAWQDLVAKAVSRHPLPIGQRLAFAARYGLAARGARLCALKQGCCAFSAAR